MPDSAKPQAAPDAEMAELIARFDRLYEALEPEEPEEVAERAEAVPHFADAEFDLPSPFEGGADSPAEVVEREIAAESPVMETNQEPVGDIDEAFAILRGAEPQRPVAISRDFEDKEDEPAPAPQFAPVERSNPLRRYAVPALAATLFVGLAAGYVAIRHTEAPGAAPSVAVPNAPLRLDYSMRQPAARDAFAEQRNPKTPGTPAR